MFLNIIIEYCFYTQIKQYITWKMMVKILFLSYDLYKVYIFWLDSNHMNDEGEAVMWVRVCTVGSNYKIKGSKYIVLSVSHQQENVNRTCEKWTRPVIIIMTYSWTPFPKELACSCCKWPSSSVVFDKSRYLFDMPHLCNQVGGWKRQIIWLIWVSMHGKELFGICMLGFPQKLW